MTLHHLPVPDPAGTPEEPERPPGFAVLLRANLPTSWVDFLPFAVIALLLRFFAKVSWPSSAEVAVILIPVSIVGFAAAQYLAVRFLPRPSPEDEEEEDDDDRR